MDETLILHHYELSPYAEKIRLMLGAKNMRWGSVLSPEQPPRPHVDPLSGGYRRIPIAQIGADVFCDTFVIAQEVSRRAKAPELDPEGASDDARQIIARAEGEVFFAAIGSVAPLTLVATMFRRLGIFGMAKFAIDRAGMMKDATVSAPQGKEALHVLQSYLGLLDERLADRDFLEGEAPSIADFSGFHPLWLNVATSGQPLDARWVNVSRWYRQMESFGHGPREELEPRAAFDAARSATPRALGDSERGTDARLGKEVSVAPSDYGTVPVTGTLVGLSTARCVVARETDDFGTIHVHFPREGYAISES